jgi:hypothetical protein
MVGEWPGLETGPDETRRRWRESAPVGPKSARIARALPGAGQTTNAAIGAHRDWQRAPEGLAWMARTMPA